MHSIITWESIREMIQEHPDVTKEHSGNRLKNWLSLRSDSPLHEDGLSRVFSNNLPNEGFVTEEEICLLEKSTREYLSFLFFISSRGPYQNNRLLLKKTTEVMHTHTSPKWG